MKNKIFLVLESVLYVVSIMAMVSLINYTKNYTFYVMFIFSLIFNNFLVLWFNKSGKYFWLKTLLLNLFFGFCIFVDGGYIKSFLYGSLAPGFFVEYVLFSLAQYLLTGNWLLPFIFNSIDKIREKKEMENSYYNSEKVVKIDGKKNRNRDDFLENIGNVLSFPDSYCKTLESLDECICNLQWLDERKIVVVIKNSDFFLLEESAEVKGCFYDVIKNAIQFWKDVGDKSFPLSEKKELVVLKDI